MFHLVYFSSATKEFTKDELQELLRKAREKNTKLGVTGMLLYKDGNFMRVLEGEEEVVTKLICTIEADSQHKGVIVPVRGTSEQRHFPDWSMGFRDLADSNIAKTPGYSNFMNTPLTGAGFTREPHRCLKLLTLFKTNM